MFLAMACGGSPVVNEKLVENSSYVWPVRTQVRAFYSGHSLSDGVPEAAARIADALGTRLSFEVQSVGYSLLRERTKGERPDAPGWDGYLRGSNRAGSGLDVLRELRAPSRVEGGHYDALVVTERHDLPDVAATEQTATYLAHIAAQAWAGSPEADVLFYHVWLPLDVGAPEAWIAYERAAERLWECIASRANLTLGRHGEAAAPRIRVLPGAAALAAAVEALWRGEVPGIEASSPTARVRLLFADDVHLSPAGTYYMGLVHYAVLFGRSPVGAPRVAGLSEAAARHLQQLAFAQATAYAPRADAAARRDMEACRAYAEQTLCPAYAALRSSQGGVLARLKRPLKSLQCARRYADREAAENPFGSHGGGRR
jgi:hypothetical protein